MLVEAPIVTAPDTLELPDIAKLYVEIARVPPASTVIEEAAALAVRVIVLVFNMVTSSPAIGTPIGVQELPLLQFPVVPDEYTVFSSQPIFAPLLNDGEAYMLGWTLLTLRESETKTIVIL